MCTFEKEKLQMLQEWTSEVLASEFGMASLEQNTPRVSPWRWARQVCDKSCLCLQEPVKQERSSHWKVLGSLWAYGFLLAKSIMLAKDYQETRLQPSTSTPLLWEWDGRGRASNTTLRLGGFHFSKKYREKDIHLVLGFLAKTRPFKKVDWAKPWQLKGCKRECKT